MLTIDRPHTGKELRQFASQLKNVPPELIAQLEEGFSGDQSPEFYAGLLAGIGVAYTFVEGGCGNYLGPLVAFVADQIERKELV
jgi:hypothetical protein